MLHAVYPSNPCHHLLRAFDPSNALARIVVSASPSAVSARAASNAAVSRVAQCARAPAGFVPKQKHALVAHPGKAAQVVERGRGRGELIRVGDVHDVQQSRRAFQVCRPQRHHGAADFFDLNGFGLVQGQVADVHADGGDDVCVDGDVTLPRSLKRHEPTREERFAGALRACVRRRRDGLSAKSDIGKGQRGRQI